MKSKASPILVSFFYYLTIIGRNSQNWQDDLALLTESALGPCNQGTSGIPSSTGLTGGIKNKTN